MNNYVHHVNGKVHRGLVKEALNLVLEANIGWDDKYDTYTHLMEHAQELELEEAVSMTDRHMKIMADFRNYKRENEEYGCWVEDFTEDSIIAFHHNEGSYYRYPFSESNGSFIFSDPIPVRKEWMDEAVEESVELSLDDIDSIMGSDHTEADLLLCMKNFARIIDEVLGSKKKKKKKVWEDDEDDEDLDEEDDEDDTDN